MNQVITTIKRLTVFFAFLFLSACASYSHIQNYPEKQAIKTVVIAKSPLSKMSDLPMGVFYDEENQIIVSGHQKGSFLGILFGPLGMLATDQANKAAGESRFGSTVKSNTNDLVQITQNELNELIASGSSPLIKLGSGNADITISPHAQFTVLPSGKAKLYALLKVDMKNSTDGTNWSARYWSMAPGEYFIEGNDGWMTNGRFSEGMQFALKNAMKVYSAEIHSTLTGAKKIKAKGMFPYIGNPVEMPFISIYETTDKIIGRLAAGDAVTFSGTHILYKNDYEISDTDFQDPRK
ncbi:hypothetical protein [Methylotenera sp. N17]|uniref:hypothetical protein n=1 Tax=Methylotenera sp. N17 TaxID=1502761 RepID=UPI001269FB2B|nr:hypothetical protein [Methylotenera sp. N17]